MGDAMNRYDVVIIGTGAGGGTLARVLAPSGKPQDYYVVGGATKFYGAALYRLRRPALTAAANAFRVGEHLLGLLGASTAGQARPAVPIR
jgi:hypothetical protein